MTRRPLAAATGALAAAALAGALAGSAAAAPPTERIFTVAGAGFFVGGNGVAIAPRLGDGGPSALAAVDSPAGVASVPDGGYLIADTYGNRIRRVSPLGIITTVAGSGRAGRTGDGGPATAARIDHPTGVAYLADGSIAIADTRSNAVRLVDPAGTIGTLAPARAPAGVAAAADGGVLVTVTFDNRVLHIDRAGVVTVAAGTGVRGFAGDGGPATAARLNRPTGIAATPDGGFLIADASGRVRRVAADGTITTAAVVERPSGVAATPDGGFLVTSVNRLLRVAPDGTITTVAGTGRGNFAGDAGLARAATLWLPRGVAALAGGGILVADTSGGRVRLIDSADPAPAAAPAPPRVLGASFRRGVQRGEVGLVTTIRVACPPRDVAVRFALSRRATVRLVAARAGRTVARHTARVAAGGHVLRVRAARTGEIALRLTATDAAGAVAADQARIIVAGCPRTVGLRVLAAR